MRFPPAPPFRPPWLPSLAVPDCVPASTVDEASPASDGSGGVTSSVTAENVAELMWKHPPAGTGVDVNVLGSTVTWFKVTLSKRLLHVCPGASATLSNLAVPELAKNHVAFVQSSPSHPTAIARQCVHVA